MATAASVMGTDLYMAAQLQQANDTYLIRELTNLCDEGLSLVRRREAAAVDPLLRHLLTSHLPLYWDRQTYADAGQLQLWNEMAEATGYTHGIVVPIHLTSTTLFYTALDWRESACLKPADGLWAMLALQTCAICAQPAAARIWRLQDLNQRGRDCTLTKRQVQCMLWASRGMTDTHIGRILGISARTVRKHVEDVIALLGASSRTEAAVIATALGLLDAPDAPSIEGAMPISVLSQSLAPRGSE